MLRGEPGMRGQGAEDEAPVRIDSLPRQLRDAIDRDDRVRQRPATLPRPDDEVRASGDRPRARIGREDAERIGQGRRRGPAVAHRRLPTDAPTGTAPPDAGSPALAEAGASGPPGSAAPSNPSRIARQTRSGVMGRRRTRAPVAAAIAFPIAPAVGTIGGSPTPFAPYGPPLAAGASMKPTSIVGASAAVGSL